MSMATFIIQGTIKVPPASERRLRAGKRMPEVIKRHCLHLQVTLPCFRVLSTRKLNNRAKLQAKRRQSEKLP